MFRRWWSRNETGPVSAVRRGRQPSERRERGGGACMLTRPERGDGDAARVAEIEMVSSRGASAAISAAPTMASWMIRERIHPLPGRRPGPASRAWNSNTTTTPKFPPPPRSAQNRSGSLSALVRRSVPSATDVVDPVERIGWSARGPAQPTHPTTQGQAAHARVRYDSRRNHEAVWHRSTVDVSEQCSTTHDAAPRRPGPPSPG